MTYGRKFQLSLLAIVIIVNSSLELLAQPLHHAIPEIFTFLVIALIAYQAGNIQHI